MKTAFLSVILTWSFLNPAFSQDILRADMYRSHGLIEDAKRDYIQVVLNDDFEDEDKAAALSALGDLAFSENNISLAVSTWTQLITNFPSSPQAGEIGTRLRQISDIVDNFGSEATENVVAEAYIRHGDWWSENKETITIIDTSWIPKDQVALGWFNKVIHEFPKTDAARLAYLKKFQTVLGWKDPGEYGETYGVLKTGKVEDLVAVLSDFSAEFPDDSNLQRLRYTVAQAYWRNEKFPETIEWLDKIVEADGDQGGFYRDLAVWRLKKVQY